MSRLGTLILEAGDALGVDLIPSRGLGYAIVSSGTSEPVVVADAVLEFGKRGEYALSDAPIEQGGFTTYNKVATPFDIQMTLACGGRNYYQDATQLLDSYVNRVLGTTFGQSMSRDDFLAALEQMLASTELYDVVTPDHAYQNLNLVHMDYRKQSRNGAVMIVAQLGFREVRVAAAPFYSSVKVLPAIDSASPSAQNPVSVGKVNLTTPTVTQASQLTAVGFV